MFRKCIEITFMTNTELFHEVWVCIYFDNFFSVVTLPRSLTLCRNWLDGYLSMQIGCGKQIKQN